MVAFFTKRAEVGVRFFLFSETRSINTWGNVQTFENCRGVKTRLASPPHKHRPTDPRASNVSLAFIE